MSKKSYMSLLKEAIAEFDTSDNVEVKGPMLDPILSWDGDGELPVYKDAASILERYYFNENAEEEVRTLDEADYENDKGSSGGNSMKNAKGAGTEQAGTSDSDTVAGSKAEKAKDIAKEAAEVDVDSDEEEVEEREFSSKDVPSKKEYTDESQDLEMENAIIEKLIAEMEEDLDETEMTYTGKGPKESMPKEKKAKGPEEDTEGAGTEQAGTGTRAGQVPNRKDQADKFVKPKNYTENEAIEEALAALEEELQLEQDDEEEAPAPTGDEGDEGDADADEEVDKDLDVDKKMKTEDAQPGGPRKMKAEDSDGDEGVYSEAFAIFKEAIDDEESDVDADDADEGDEGDED